MLGLRRRSPRAVRLARRFSSSPGTRPSLFDDFSSYVNRVLSRTGQLERYREHSVFPPSNWTLHNYYLYTQLQLPSRTEIDAVDFLNGARFACDRVLRAMHSKELLDFAADKSPRPEIADEMEQMFDPTCYQRLFLPRVKRLGVGVASLELQEMDFTGVYLCGVHCNRTTRANLRAEETLRAVVGDTIAQNLKNRPKNERPNVMDVVSDLSDIKEKLAKTVDKSATEPEDNEIVERLRLDALFHTTQTVEAVSAKTSERYTVTTNVKTRLSFESLVTEPDDVDWRIITMNQLGRVLSRTKEN